MKTQQFAQQQEIYELLPEVSFKFNYLQTQNPDDTYAQRLIEDLEEER